MHNTNVPEIISVSLRKSSVPNHHDQGLDMSAQPNLATDISPMLTPGYFKGSHAVYPEGDQTVGIPKAEERVLKITNFINNEEQ